MLIIGILIGIAVGLVLGYFGSRLISANVLEKAKQEARELVEQAKVEADTLRQEKLVEVEEEVFELKNKVEQELQKERLKVEELSKALDNKEVDLEQREMQLNKKDAELKQKDAELERKAEELKAAEVRLNELIEQEVKTLERIANMTQEEAQQKLIEQVKEEADIKAKQIFREIIEQAELEANRKAKEIVVSAIQQTAADQSVESTVSIINLPNDDMKGRIIGREGRNIRAFEQVTGIDIIIDDTPEIVVLSGYNPIRREIARRAMEKLIADGRIHPARIEEIVQKTREEMDDILQEIGENATIELGIHGVQDDLIKLVGKLKFYTSYGQNLLNHSMEVAHLAGLMASELGLDPDIAKKAGLFHDIGKVVENYSYAQHAQLGAETLKKFGINELVVNAVAAHHNLEEASSPYAILVQAADTISGSRPGARRESLEQFIRRMEQLEEIAREFDGVTEAYAIQAGKEVHVMVDCEKLSDEDAEELADNIVKRIQEEIEYPGQIKVTVIREKRAYDVAT
ncbi:MAG: ribonuclease Y [Methanobacteriota archaeon]|nr:MAG: ribonuclease Y [Euryarchaeota archaeon]